MCTYRGQGVNAGCPTLLTFILFSEFSPCACACGRCLWRLAGRTLDSLELELWVVCWESNFRLLKQQQVVLTAEPSLQPHLSLNLEVISRGWPASPRDPPLCPSCRCHARLSLGTLVLRLHSSKSLNLLKTCYWEGKGGLSLPIWQSNFKKF